MIDLAFLNVSKRYRIPSEGAPPPGLIGRWRHRIARPTTEFWAVRDVNFEISRGESVGVIGHNGAGKSTMLKLLSSITAPTQGEIHVNGRIAALLEVGSGFHPELTGRENVYLGGALLGMRRAEITSKLDRIVEFAGMSRFIDVPVKRYSSGMYVRLGFSMAAHLEPDILLLDEVLAVGDASFQDKCIGRIEQLRNSGITIVFISHDLMAVQRICSRVLLMQQGQLAGSGTAEEMIHRYHEISRFQNTRSVERNITGARAASTGIEFLSPAGDALTALPSGGPVLFRLRYETPEAVSKVRFLVVVQSLDGVAQFTLDSRLAGRLFDLPAGGGEVDFHVDSLPLRDGFYAIDTVLYTEYEAEALDYQPGCATVQVQGERVREGLYYVPQRVEVRPAAVVSNRS